MAGVEQQEEEGRREAPLPESVPLRLIPLPSASSTAGPILLPQSL